MFDRSIAKMNLDELIALRSYGNSASLYWSDGTMSMSRSAKWLDQVFEYLDRREADFLIFHECSTIFHVRKDQITQVTAEHTNNRWNLRISTPNRNFVVICQNDFVLEELGKKRLLATQGERYA